MTRLTLNPQTACARALRRDLECLNEKHGHPAANVLKQGYREDGEGATRRKSAVSPRGACSDSWPALAAGVLNSSIPSRHAGGLVCESDTDEQLLFNIPFNQVRGRRGSL